MANIRGIELASEVYDLEDTSARDTATTASQTATQAGQTATQAEQTATQASQTATQASQMVAMAIETATQASQTATQASQTATEAEQTATQAQTTAAQAQTTATQAQTTAIQAQTTATQAQTTATQASDTAGQAALNANLARNEIGDISSLETSDTSDLVSAINEVNEKASPVTDTFTTSESGLTVTGTKKGNLVQLFIRGKYESNDTPVYNFEESLPEEWCPSKLIRAFGLEENNNIIKYEATCGNSGQISLSGLETRDVQMSDIVYVHMVYMI